MSSPAAEGAAQVLDTFSLPSQTGNERLALARVAQVAADQGLNADQLDRLKTAVAEATMNAIEHGNGLDPGRTVDIEVLHVGGAVMVTITDLGADRAEHARRETPDLLRKLRGEQTPRGWGLFLIEHMVDRMDVSTDGQRHTVALTMRIEPDPSERSEHGQ